MTDETTNPSTESALQVDTSGSDFKLQTYDIAPEDAAIAAEIAAFDPVYGTRGPVSVDASVKLPAEIKASGLPPHLRDPIMQQLASVPPANRDAEEARLVGEALYQNSYGVRVAAGPGSGANAYQRAFFLLEFDKHQAEQELDRLGTILGEMEETASVVTDASGQQRVETRHKVQGQRRAALEAEFARAVHNYGLLNGVEGDRRLQRGKFEAVAEVKAMRDQLAREAEARALGEKMERDSWIEGRAKLYAKSKRSTL